MSPGRIAMGYAVVATLWIAFSDGVVTYLKLDPAVMTLKGTLFVFLTASLLYFTIRRLIDTIRQSATYLAEAQRLSHTGSWAFEVAGQKYVYASEECVRIFELDAREDSQTRAAVSRLIHPEDWPRVNEDFEKSVLEKVDTASEFRITLPSGAVKHVRTIRHPVLNAAGEVVQLMGSVIDISEAKRAEEKLRQQEMELREVLDVTPQLVAVFGPDRNRLYANRPTLDYFGVTLEEWLSISDPFWFFHPDDRAHVSNDVYAGPGSGAPHEFEARLRRKDGAYRWFLLRDNALHDQHGHITRWYISATDIEDRKQAEDERRESATRFQAIADYTYDWENWVGNDGTLLWVNPAVERITGYAVDECMAMPGFPIPIVAEADRETVGREIREAVQGSSRNDFEFRVRRKDGCRVWVAASWQPIYDSRGARLGHRSSIRDIGERKRAEEALRDSETRFRTFVDHAADAFFMLDFEHGTILDVNQTACESLDYTREELLGMTPLAFDVDLDRATLDLVAERAAAGETVVFERHRHRRKDGSLFPVEVQTSFFSHGGRRLLLKVSRDITDRVRAEEQRDRLRQLESELAHINRVSMLGELAASIAHEIGQPLAGVVSNGGACLRWLACEVPDLDEAREAARRIVRDGKRAGEIIGRIRALSKKTVTPNDKLALNATIQELLALVGDQAKRVGVIVHTQFAADLAPVYGDRVQLQQVVLNLVMNAMEAMSSVEGRRRELVITTRNSDLDLVQVTVEDAGPGLDPVTLDKIFDAFYTTKSGGMGMGLSISRSIVQAHGGRLWATAKDGPGAMFHFTLPTKSENGPA